MQSISRLSFYHWIPTCTFKRPHHRQLAAQNEKSVLTVPLQGTAVIKLLPYQKKKNYLSPNLRLWSLSTIKEVIYSPIFSKICKSASKNKEYQERGLHILKMFENTGQLSLISPTLITVIPFSHFWHNAIFDNWLKIFKVLFGKRIHWTILKIRKELLQTSLSSYHFLQHPQLS